MAPSRLWRSFGSLISWAAGAALVASAYEVPVSDKDSRQACSGMYGGDSAYINVTFQGTSQGQLAMVMYEWSDSSYLGKFPADAFDDRKVYVCTTDALMGGLCDGSQLGRFIINLPERKSINETSFWSARVDLSSSSSSSASGFWDNPEGNPTPPPGNGTTAWKRRSLLNRQDGPADEHGHTEVYHYTQPIKYDVKKTGFYCVAIVPVTLKNSAQGESGTDVPFHPVYQGTILFHNTFEGKLPATDYPKVNFYFAMLLLYTTLAAGWGWLCYRHVNELLPMQYYLSSLVGLLVIEMVANFAYYRYLNAHGKGAASTVFLIVVAILDAGRNSLSFFMLLVVSLGLSVVRESLGRTMLKCQLLAAAHFIFGILYAVGIVELELESTSAFVLLIFIIPLAFTLSGFLLWIMYALNATIAQLRARKQRYKLKMFERLNHILIIIVIVIAIFFVVSSMSFSGRMAEDYAAQSWKSRWWLLDGWLALKQQKISSFGLLSLPLTYLSFTLSMSDELAQDEEDAEDYDLEALESRTRARDDDDDDNATLVGDRRGGPAPLRDDHVVFEIGDEDAGSDDEDESKKQGRIKLQSSENLPGDAQERQGLIGNGASRDRND
ncbi:hypothetical protein EYR40_003756 [Pleurotus pulmonarius]|nr:hypothetical protein EYR40_003756 [Pleurotus pulmonarius]KAF4606467.1 hypothetical protein EYR38_000521 [Pleurotus pulmonarius]